MSYLCLVLQPSCYKRTFPSSPAVWRKRNLSPSSLSCSASGQGEFLCLLAAACLSSRQVRVKTRQPKGLPTKPLSKDILVTWEERTVPIKSHRSDLSNQLYHAYAEMLEKVTHVQYVEWDISQIRLNGKLFKRNKDCVITGSS